MVLTISNPNLTVEPGGTITFMGTFTNTSSTDTFEFTSAQLNDVFFMMPAFTQLPYASSFINGDFMVLNGTINQYAPGASFTGPIFSVTVSPSAAEGYYPLLPGYTYMNYNSHDMTTGADILFTPGPGNLSVTVVPEPSTGALLALAIGGLSLASRRKQRKNLAKLAD